MWDLATLIIVPTLIIVGIGLLVLSRFLFKRASQEHLKPYGDPVIFKAFGWGSAVGALICVIILAIGLYPYEKEYFYWEDRSGIVEVVESRMINADNGMKEKFVVKFVGSQQEYGCDDTRCALIKPGDRLTLSCIREWQYAGSDGYDCNFKRNEGQG